ncbi:hypothetical protein [Vibrio maritimus]
MDKPKWGSGAGGLTAASAGIGAQTESKEQTGARVIRPYDS